MRKLASTERLGSTISARIFLGVAGADAGELGADLAALAVERVALVQRAVKSFCPAATSPGVGERRGASSPAPSGGSGRSGWRRASSRASRSGLLLVQAGAICQSLAARSPRVSFLSLDAVEQRQRPGARRIITATRGLAGGGREVRPLGDESARRRRRRGCRRARRSGPSHSSAPVCGLTWSRIAATVAASSPRRIRRRRRRRGRPAAAASPASAAGRS